MTSSSSSPPRRADAPTSARPALVFEVTKTIAAYTTDGIAPGGGLKVTVMPEAALELQKALGVKLFSALFTWWSLPFDRTGNRIGTANFGQRGIAPIAYALFALALGAFLGTVIRRTVPAIFSEVRRVTGATTSIWFGVNGLLPVGAS